MLCGGICWCILLESLLSCKNSTRNAYGGEEAIVSRYWIQVEVIGIMDKGIWVIIDKYLIQVKNVVSCNADLNSNLKPAVGTTDSLLKRSEMVCGKKFWSVGTNFKTEATASNRPLLQLWIPLIATRREWSMGSPGDNYRTPQDCFGNWKSIGLHHPSFQTVIRSTIFYPPLHHISVINPLYVVFSVS